MYTICIAFGGYYVDKRWKSYFEQSAIEIHPQRERSIVIELIHLITFFFFFSNRVNTIQAYVCTYVFLVNINKKTNQNIYRTFKLN